MLPFEFTILGALEAQALAHGGRIDGVTYAVQLQDVEGRAFPEIAPIRLRLRVNDEDDPDIQGAPTKETVREILCFMRKVPLGGRVVFQCQGGISRSTAAALIALVAGAGAGKEMQCALAIARQRPIAEPNRLMIQIADGIFGSQGKLIEAANFIAARARDRASQGSRSPIPVPV